MPMAKVIAIDDSPDDLRLIADLLSKDKTLDVELTDSGTKALQRIRDSRPDLVIVDIDIPDLDGLELLKQIKIHYSDVPVIITTGAGRESVAIQALDSGAATYVAKSQLANSLHDAVREVLAIAESNRIANQLMACTKETHFEFDLESDPALIEPMVQLVLKNLNGFESETQRVRIGVALEHALINALYRGNLEITPEQMEAAREQRLLGIDADPVAQRRSEAPYRDRKIYVAVSISPKMAKLVVRDEGPGFDVARFDSLTVDEASQQPADRGIVLMKNLMDKVVFNEQGNEVTLIKHVANGY